MTVLNRRPLVVRVSALLVVAALASACGGGDPSTDAAAEATTPSVTVSGPGAPAPGGLPFTDLGLELIGPETVSGAPGGDVAVEFVFDNPTDSTFTVRFDVTDQDGVELIESTDRLRVAPERAGTFNVVLGIAADVAVGAQLPVEVSVVEVGASEHRTSASLIVLVNDGMSTAPEVGGDDASTATNQRVSSYVVFDDTDPDGDLDVTTLRVIGGGFVAESVTADASGTITYVPFADLTGVDYVLYEVCDAARLCGAGVLRVDIQAA